MRTDELKAVLGSYARAFLVAALAVYSTGDMNIRHMLYAGIAAVVGPAIRALNPKDPAFGRVSLTIERELIEWIDKLIESEKEARKPVKKKKSPKKK